MITQEVEHMQVRDVQASLSFLQGSLGLKQHDVRALLKAHPALLRDGAAPVFQSLRAALGLDAELMKVTMGCFPVDDIGVVKPVPTAQMPVHITILCNNGTNRYLNGCAACAYALTAMATIEWMLCAGASCDISPAVEPAAGLGQGGAAQPQGGRAAGRRSS